MLNRHQIAPEELASVTRNGSHEYKKEFVALCRIKGCAINKNTEKKVTELSAHNFERLQKLTTNLENIGKLTSDTFALALQRVTASIPSVPQSKNNKQAVADGHVNKLDDNTTFFMKRGASRNHNDSGGQAKINIGYTASDAKTPSISVKRLCLAPDEYQQPKDKVANREVKIQRLLGRRANWYPTKKGPAVAGEWQTGESLEDFKGDFSSYTYSRRLKWLTSALTELNKLHANFRLHGDIKPGNIIVDVAQDKLKFIDFATTQKVNSTKDFVASPMYVDMKEGKPKKLASDMFAMGYIVARLFPELFTFSVNRQLAAMQRGGMTMLAVVARPPYVLDKNITDNVTNKEQAIYALVDAMMEECAELRCTSQQALQFCENAAAHLVINGETLTVNNLKSLLDTTINGNSYVTEDALRGSIRPSKFGAIATPAAPQQKLNNSGVKHSSKLFAAKTKSSSSLDKAAIDLGKEHRINSIDSRGRCTIL